MCGYVLALYTAGHVVFNNVCSVSIIIASFASSNKRNASVRRPSVHLSHFPQLNVTHQGQHSTQRGQRTFLWGYYEDGPACLYCIFVSSFTCYALVANKERNLQSAVHLRCACVSVELERWSSGWVVSTSAGLFLAPVQRWRQSHVP